MHILDLPAELFECIIRLHVEDFGAVPAWKNQLVCKTFAVYIKFEVLARQSTCHFRKIKHKSAGHLILQHNVSEFLQYRVAALNGAEPYLPAYIKHTISAIGRLFPGDNAASKTDKAKILCDLVAKECVAVPELLRIDYKSRAAQSYIRDWCKLSTGNFTTASAAFGELKAVKWLVIRHPDTLWKQSPAFGAPLCAAAYSGQTMVVQAIVDHYNRNFRETPTEEHRVAMQTAVTRCLQTRNYPLCQMLLRFRSDTFTGPVSIKTFREWICEAIETGEVQLVRLVLTEKHRGGLDLYAEGYSLACKLQQHDIVHFFLDHGLVVLNKPVGRRGCPLVMAVLKGNAAVVKHLLNLGANPNGVFKQEPSSNNIVSTLHYAARAKRVDIVRILLNAGANTSLAGRYGQDMERSDHCFWEVDELIDRAAWDRTHGVDGLNPEDYDSDY